MTTMGMRVIRAGHDTPNASNIASKKNPRGRRCGVSLRIILLVPLLVAISCCCPRGAAGRRADFRRRTLTAELLATLYVPLLDSEPSAAPHGSRRRAAWHRWLPWWCRAWCCWPQLWC